MAMESHLGLGPFNRSRVAKHRDRAAARFGQVSFLKDRAIDDLCDRLAFINRNFGQGLDVGSHGGLLGAAIKQRPEIAGKIGFLAQCDLSAAMMARAPRFGFVGDEEYLPLAEKSLDLFVSALSLHWVNDVPGFLAQARLSL